MRGSGVSARDLGAAVDGQGVEVAVEDDDDAATLHLHRVDGRALAQPGCCAASVTVSILKLGADREEQKRLVLVADLVDAAGRRSDGRPQAGRPWPSPGSEMTKYRVQPDIAEERRRGCRRRLRCEEPGRRRRIVLDPGRLVLVDDQPGRSQVEGCCRRPRRRRRSRGCPSRAKTNWPPFGPQGRGSWNEAWESRCSPLGDGLDQRGGPSGPGGKSSSWPSALRCCA